MAPRLSKLKSKKKSYGEKRVIKSCKERRKEKRERRRKSKR